MSDVVNEPTELTAEQPSAPVAPPPPAPGYLALVARAEGGDAAAFSALVTALHPLVHRWALVFAADPDEADDIVQDAFVQMHRRLAQFRGDAPLEAWLYRIVRRVAGQWRRTAQRRRRREASAHARPEPDLYLTDPGARVDRQWVAERIHAFFGDLPARQREIFDLVDLQGLEPSEVARLTGMNAATVRANLFKARAAVRARVIARHPAAAELTR